MTNQRIHTGEMLESKLQQLGISKAELGRRINRPATTVLSYTRQSSIQTRILTNISIALGYNFYADVMESLPDELKLSQPQQSANLELQKLKEENDYLKKIIDLFAKK